MKRGNDSRTGVQGRTSMKDKSMHRNAQQSGRPKPSQNTINPNRGLNEDAQNQRTNQDEEDETTNAYTESSQKDNSEKRGDENAKSTKRSEDRGENHKN